MIIFSHELNIAQFADIQKRAAIGFCRSVYHTLSERVIFETPETTYTSTYLGKMDYLYNHKYSEFLSQMPELNEVVKNDLIQLHSFKSFCRQNTLDHVKKWTFQAITQPYENTTILNYLRFIDRKIKSQEEVYKCCERVMFVKTETIRIELEKKMAKLNKKIASNNVRLLQEFVQLLENKIICEPDILKAMEKSNPLDTLFNQNVAELMQSIDTLCMLKTYSDKYENIEMSLQDKEALRQEVDDVNKKLIEITRFYERITYQSTDVTETHNALNYLHWVYLDFAQKYRMEKLNDEIAKTHAILEKAVENKPEEEIIATAELEFANNDMQQENAPTAANEKISHVIKKILETKPCDPKEEIKKQYKQTADKLQELYDSRKKYKDILTASTNAIYAKCSQISNIYIEPKRFKQLLPQHLYELGLNKIAFDHKDGSHSIFTSEFYNTISEKTEKLSFSLPVHTNQNQYLKVLVNLVAKQIEHQLNLRYETIIKPIMIDIDKTLDEKIRLNKELKRK